MSKPTENRAGLPVVWNTQRKYTRYGQRIAAKVIPGGVLFVDIDRCIDGFIESAEPVHRGDLQEFVMAIYDNTGYASPHFASGANAKLCDQVRAAWFELEGELRKAAAAATT